MLLALGIGALGFAAIHRAHRCRQGWYGGHGRHWHRHHWHGWHGGWHGRDRAGLYYMLAHLDASPTQERAIVAEVDGLRDKLYGAKDRVRGARGDLAGAIRGPSLDDAALGAVLGAVDAATTDARTAVLDAIRNIHAVLDDRQRAQLADLLEGGRGRWRGPGGSPYRV